MSKFRQMAQPLRWRALLRPGDWLVLGLSCALVFTLARIQWFGTVADTVRVHVGGRLLHEYPLRLDRSFSVNGALGPTWIAIEGGRSRVVSDPSPRQYCVRQGWLSAPGDLALCAPNQVALEIGGRVGYDSIVY